MNNAVYFLLKNPRCLALLRAELDTVLSPSEIIAPYDKVRYHSFYPWHSAGAYMEFMDEHDEKMLEAVRAFNPYDLYSKSDDVPKVEDLKLCNTP